MPYNFQVPEPPKSDSRMFEIGARLGSDIMDYRLKKQVLSEERKQRELDEATNRLHAQELQAISSTFPVQGTPQEQNSWLGENAPRMGQYKGGTQLWNSLQDVFDNNSQMRLDTTSRKIASQKLADTEEANLRFGGDITALRQDKSATAFNKELDLLKLPRVPFTPEAFTENGFINPVWKNNEIIRLQKEQASIGNVPNTGYEYDIRRMVVLKPQVEQLEEALRNAQTQEEDTAIRQRLNPLREELNLREQRQTQKNDSPVLSGLPPEMRALLMAKQKEIVESNSKNKHAELKSLYESFGQTYNVSDFSSPIPAPSSATSTNRTSSGVKWSVQP